MKSEIKDHFFTRLSQVISSQRPYNSITNIIIFDYLHNVFSRQDHNPSYTTKITRQAQYYV